MCVAHCARLIVSFCIHSLQELIVFENKVIKSISKRDEVTGS
jgi:hypothetical protein